MSKRANPMAVKAALTYDVGEAAAALGRTPATIRNWIKDGLPVMASKKPYLISGAALRVYLQAKRKEAKTQLKPDELFCLSCRAGRTPQAMAATFTPINDKTSLLKGFCSHCGARATRMISTSQISEYAKTFDTKEGEPSEA